MRLQRGRAGVAAGVVAAVLAIPGSAQAIHEPDLAVSLSDTADPVTVGDPLAYWLGVVNNGFSDAPNTHVSIVFSHPVELTSAGDPGTDDRCRQRTETTVICRFRTVQSGGGLFTSIVVIPSEVGQLTATATVDAATGDPNPANDTATEVTTVE